MEINKRTEYHKKYMKELFMYPIQREMFLARRRELRKDPINKQKRSTYCKERVEDPEYRKARLVDMKIRRENPDKKEQIAANIKSWGLKHPEYNKKRKKTVVYKEWVEEYKKTAKFKEGRKRRHLKRKHNLGYNQLNSKFVDCNGHHIDINNVINIPTTLHKSIQHKQSDNNQMLKINILAWDYLESSSY